MVCAILDAFAVSKTYSIMVQDRGLFIFGILGIGFFFAGIRRFYLALEGTHMWKGTPWHCMLSIQTPFFIAGSQATAFMLVVVSVDRLLAVRWFASYMSFGTK